MLIECPLRERGREPAALVAAASVGRMAEGYN